MQSALLKTIILTLSQASSACERLRTEEELSSPLCIDAQHTLSQLRANIYTYIDTLVAHVLTRTEVQGELLEAIALLHWSDRMPDRRQALQNCGFPDPSRPPMLLPTLEGLVTAAAEQRFHAITPDPVPAAAMRQYVALYIDRFAQEQAIYASLRRPLPTLPVVHKPRYVTAIWSHGAWYSGGGFWTDDFAEACADADLNQSDHPTLRFAVKDTHDNTIAYVAAP